MTEDESRETREAEEEAEFAVSKDARELANLCVENAEDLLRGAQTLLDAGQPNLSYHLATLAIEEIGKSDLIQMADRARSQGRQEQTWRPEKSFDDHVRKLFWAIWLPSLRREAVSRKQFEEYLGLARAIHDRRQRGLYAPTSKENWGRPSEALSRRDALAILRVAQSRVESEKAFTPARLKKEDREALDWFYQACEHEERSKFVFGKEAMAKLAELGTAPAWIAWLRSRIDSAEAEARELLEEEMRRQEPRGQKAKEPKWQLRFRLFSDSHSLRQKALSDWNDTVSWIKLTAAKSKVLVVDVTLPKSVPAEGVWDVGMGIKQDLMAALSIGSMGLFWWELPKHTSRYYEKLTDLESSREVAVERRPKLELDWGREALDINTMDRVKLCFVGMHWARQAGATEALTRYANGLAAFAKTDVHLDFSLIAFVEFYHALVSSLKAFGDWDGEEPIRDAVARLGKDGQLGPLERFVAMGEDLAQLKEKRTPQITLTEVGGIKILCDAHFRRAFNRMAQDRAENGED